MITLKNDNLFVNNILNDVLLKTGSLQKSIDNQFKGKVLIYIIKYRVTSHNNNGLS